MNEKICENLKDENHVWVVLKGKKNFFLIFTNCYEKKFMTLEDIDSLGPESLRNSTKGIKNFVENENENFFYKNSSTNEFRIRPQSSIPRYMKKN